MSEAGTVRARKREAVLEPICDHLLANGLDAANLRALAKAAGTSDRMLLYYFADKDDLIAVALDRLAMRLASALDARTPERPMPPDQLSETVWSAVCEPELWPFMLLFVELVVLAARVGEPFASPARAISARLQTWLATHIAIDGKDARHAEAERILATIDGRVLLRMAEEGPASVRDHTPA